MKLRMTCITIIILLFIITGSRFANQLYSLKEEVKMEKIEIDGKYLKAFISTYDDFLKIEDMTNDEKHLSHYNIQFLEEKDVFIIYYGTKLVDKGGYFWHGIGRPTEYKIDKKTFKIVKRIFYKN